IRDFHVTGVQTCALPILACILSMSLSNPVGVRRRAAATAPPPATTGPASAAGPPRKSRLRLSSARLRAAPGLAVKAQARRGNARSEEHTSELQSRENLVC